MTHQIIIYLKIISNLQKKRVRHSELREESNFNIPIHLEHDYQDYMMDRIKTI